MNEQLPPVDPRLGEHLARRSAGRVPPGLLTDVISELDRTPVRLDRPRVAFALGHRNRQTAGALAGLAAVVALVAALIAMPALQTGPSALKGYPTDRALTTAELAAVMAGPALAANTALVAEVTIQTRTDVCPMNRYPTIGVVEGMRAQVCVMGSGVGAYMNVAQQSGVFAFRYLAPGVLGLVGQVTPASSRLAFHVADDWPLTGKTFVVEAWLGGTPFVQWACPAGGISAGDALLPNGGECGLESWLADTATPGAIGTAAGKAFANASVDPIALFGDARLVKAGGMRQIDSVASAPPQHGEYLVRSSTGGCPGDPPTSSRGCPYWLVLAKLAAITVPAPTATPIATPTPQAPSGYPIDRALTTSELGRLLDANTLKHDDIVVVDAEVSSASAGICTATATEAQGSAPERAGIVATIDPPVCVYAMTGITVKPGHLVLRMLGERQLGYMATVPAAPTGLAYHATGQWPDGFFLAQGWLDTAAAACGSASLPGFGGPQTLFPVYSAMCHAALSDTRFTLPTAPTPSPSSSGPVATPAGTGGVAATTLPPIPPYPVPSDGRAVDAAPYFEIPAYAPESGSTQGVFLVDRDHHCSIFQTTDCEEFFVLARVTDIALPAPQVPSGYPFDRALTTSELGRLLDGGSLKQYDTVLVDAQVEFAPSSCTILDSLNPINLAGVIAGLSPTTCVYSSSATGITPGHLVLRVLGAHSLGYMGTVTAPTSGGPLAYAAADSWPGDGSTFLVAGWLSGLPHSCPALPSPTAPTILGASRDRCSWNRLTSTSTPVAWPSNDPGLASGLVAAEDALAMQSIDDFNAPVHGVYVVRSCSPASSSPCSQPLVLARLTDIALPLAPTATPPPPATPVPQPTPTTASSYPSARALTTAELDQFLQTAEGIKDKVLVAQVSFAQTNGCAPVGSYKPIGLIAGMKSDVCVVGIGDGRPEHSPASTSGVSAFRVLDSHTLGFMGDISTASDGRLALTSADAWPDGKTILVNGWHTTGAGLIFCPMIPALTSDPLDPGAMPCGPTWMVTEPLPGPVSTTPPLSAHPQSVWWPAYPTGGLPTPDGEATYLLRDTNSDCNRNTGRYCGWRILGVVDSVRLPQAAPAPTPSGSSGTGLTTPGLWGSGNRPLTMAELLSAYKADRLHLAGRIVITKGPVPADLACATSFNFPETCQYLSETTTGGYWAVKVGADGKLGVVGEMSTANSSFVSSIAQANAAKVPADQVVVVDAWLDWANDCDTPSSTPPCFFSVLTNESVSWMHMRSLFPWDSVPAWEVQDDAYTTFGGDPTLQHPARGLYLVRPDGYGAATILARLETTSSTNP